MRSPAPPGFVDRLQRVPRYLRGAPEWIAFHLWLAALRGRTGRPAVLLIRGSGLGDVICCLPLYRALRQKYPGANVVFLTRRVFLPIVRACPDVEFAAPAPRTFRPEFILRHPWLVQAVICPMAADEPGGDPALRASHLIEALRRSGGIKEAAPDWPRLVVAEAEKQKAKRRLGGGSAGRTIVLHSGRSWPAREWPETHWQRLVELLRAAGDARLIHLCSPERSRGDATKPFHLPGTEEPGEVTPGETMALIASADFFIGIDSGPLHLAGALGIPLIGLFGAIDPALRLYPGQKSRGVWQPLPCSFCHHREPVLHWQDGCPYDIRCMTDLRPETVLEVAKSLLACKSL